MNPIEVERMRDAAVQAMITERCRRAYIHDVRGGLQAIAGAVEILARLAHSSEGKAGAVERASAMARRALANHETAMLEMIGLITSSDEGRVTVQLGGLTDDIIRFLRNDLASKDIALRFSRTAEPTIEVRKHKLQLILLGLIALRIDDCPAGGELGVRLARSDAYALLELTSTELPQAPSERSILEPRELLVDMAREWLAEQGGRLERTAEPSAQSTLSIYYPLAPETLAAEA